MTQDKTEVQVRKMVDSDLPRVNAIDGLLFGKERAPTWPFTFEAYWRVYRPDLSFVAEVGDEVVGFVVGNIVEEEHSQSVTRVLHSTADSSRHRWVGWMDMIGIHPGYQHKGIGRELVGAFYEECKRNNAVVRGVAREGDERLNDFLVALGFKKWDIVTYEKD